MANNNGGNETNVIVREVNLSAEIKKIWGKRWNEPEIAYEVGDRKYTLRTGDAAIYASSPDFG